MKSRSGCPPPPLVFSCFIVGKESGGEGCLAVSGSQGEEAGVESGG